MDQIMNIIEQDILSIEEGNILHQVNCKQVMGSGLAKAIRDKWPSAYDDYMRVAARHDGLDFLSLGMIVQSEVVPGKIWVYHCFTQYDYNKPGVPFQKHTDYKAIISAFYDVAGNVDYLHRRHSRSKKIYIPYNYGCARGGGEWEVVSRIINSIIPDANICKLPKPEEDVFNIIQPK
jgi:hypothetical protein